MQKNLNTKDAADYIGFSSGTLEIWRQKAKGPKFHKVSGKVFYKKNDLDKWIIKGGN